VFWAFLKWMAMQARTDFDVVVVGGGVVGLACGYKISQRQPGVRVAVLEKEDRLAAHQSGRNSGVLHSGLYYKPGSKKAATCTAGRKELIAFAAKHRIPHQICGKVIVATSRRELPAMEKIFNNAQANGVEGIEKIGPERIRQIEPEAAGIAGLHVPSAGIIDFVAVANKLAELIQANGKANKVLTSHLVVGLDRHDFYTNVQTNRSSIGTRYVINCAGLQCDRVARMDQVNPGVRIIPFRGDYHELTESACPKVKALVYPVPDPDLPFLGVHFTRMIAGGVECGPNAVFSFKREGYRKMDFSLADTRESLSYWGTWRLFMKQWQYGLGEYARAFSKKLLVRQLQRLVPSVELSDLRPGQAGVRAQALGPKGELIDDFKIEATDRAIHVLNAPSPAATACLAIGDHVASLAATKFQMADK
jgi:L-2-hydroxyglutarate oxidase